MALSYRNLATSQHPTARWARRLRSAVTEFTLPAPRLLILPMFWVYRAVVAVLYYLMRVLLSEPLLKAQCRRCGRGVRADIWPPYIMGRGNIDLADNVHVDGKVTITFASRFSERPELIVGERSHIGHLTAFTIAKRVTIGSNCLIAKGAIIFDSSGHPTDPEQRLQGLPPAEDAVQPVTIGNNVWIGKHAMIFPGVTIGDGSVVAAGSVVMRDVPPNTLVAGNPARNSMALGPQ